MDVQEIRIECLRLASGDVIKGSGHHEVLKSAKAYADWILGEASTAEAEAQPDSTLVG